MNRTPSLALMTRPARLASSIGANTPLATSPAPQATPAALPWPAVPAHRADLIAEARAHLRSTARHDLPSLSGDGLRRIGQWLARHGRGLRLTPAICREFWLRRVQHALG